MRKLLKSGILLVTSLIVVAAMAGPVTVPGHKGPVDKDGCHLDKKDRKHCH